MDDGPHTSRCDGREDCWGECWDEEEWPTTEDLKPDSQEKQSL